MLYCHTPRFSSCLTEIHTHTAEQLDKLIRNHHNPEVNLMQTANRPQLVYPKQRLLVSFGLSENLPGMLLNPSTWVAIQTETVFKHVLYGWPTVAIEIHIYNIHTTLYTHFHSFLKSIIYLTPFPCIDCLMQFYTKTCKTHNYRIPSFITGRAQSPFTVTITNFIILTYG